MLRRLTEEPERPYVVVLGGAKVSDKLGVIDNLLKTVDRLLIGGGMVYTFLKAQGHEVGLDCSRPTRSTPSRASSPTRRSAASRSCCRSTSSWPTRFAADADHDVVAADAIPADRMGLDIGPASAALFADEARRRPHGVLERPDGRLRDGAVRRAAPAPSPQALTDVTADGALTVVGGGDSAAAVRQLGFADDQFGHISTGGGASLEYLEGKKLPGLTVLDETTDEEGS